MIRKALQTTADLFGSLERATRRLGSRYLTPTDPYILKTRAATSDPIAKIVHVNGNFVVGGNTQLIVDIIERTSDLYSHEVVVPEYPRPLPYTPVNIHEFQVTQMPALFDHFRKTDPDLVHFNYWVKEELRYEERAIWFQTVFRICEELRVPVIQNITVPAFPYASPAIVHNIFVSRFVEENFNTQPDVPFSVIYPGSDLHHFRNDDVGSLPGNAIGMVYRLDPDKLNPEAIEVFISAVKKKPSLTCHIIGDGEFFEDYKKRVRDEGLSRNFIFYGMVSYSRLPEYYRKFSVFVAPVHDESFGQVTPFAMGMGLAVAGYDVGALPEILGSREILAKPGDVDQLSDLIVDLTDDAGKRIAFGKANQRRAADNFSVEKMIEEIKELYRNILSKDG